MCPLSIVDLWFFRNVLLRSIGQFSLNSFTRFYSPALPSRCIWRTSVPKSLIHTEVIDREVYTQSGIKISLLLGYLTDSNAAAHSVDTGIS